MTEMCNEVRGAIALEGRAPDNDDFQKHVRECPECAQFLKSVLAVEGELGSLASLDVSDEVVDTLLARPELTKSARSHKAQWLMGLAAAAAIVFVAARITLMGRGDLRRESEVADFRRNYRPEMDELSAEDRQQLESLGYGGGYAQKLPDDQRTNASTDDNVVPREVWENEVDVGSPEGLRAGGGEQNQRGHFRSLNEEEGAATENKNEAPKKDSALGFDADEVATSTYSETVSRTAKRASVAGRVDAPVNAPELEPPGPPPAPISESVVVSGKAPVVDVQTREHTGAFDKAQLETDGFKSKVVGPGEAGGFGGGFYQRTPEPKKLVHVDAVYPESSKQKRVSGTVVLRLLIDAEGNVTRAVVIESVEGLDPAATDAVMQWKYVKSEEAERTVIVRIAFETPSNPNDDARLFLDERERIDGLHFRDPRGYWANTYLPGDPKARFLAMRLAKAEHTVAPHVAARPVVQPFDAPNRGALSLTLHADHRGISGPERMLVQLGIQASESHGRRRPPMNVGIVLDATQAERASARAVIDSLLDSKALADRFRLILPGKGEVVAPESFRHGPLTVALDELAPCDGIENAVRLAMERVHAGDDPTMPLGSSLVLVLTQRKLGDELDTLTRLAHRSAVGGVPVSIVAMGTAIDRDEIERLALAGQGRRYFLEHATDATRIIDRELAASSRVVARALRLRIKLAADVKLVDVIGSRPLNERQAERVRVAEKSIDLRLSRNLGIDADRGEDEDGIQIVIPSLYAGDAHTILLDVVVSHPGPVAEVTARYKDLAELRNTVAQASLGLPRSTSLPGPLETNVVKNYLAFHLSEMLEGAADQLDRGNRTGAIEILEHGQRLLTGLPFAGDAEIGRDVAMLHQYVSVLTSSTEPAFVAYLVDSLRYASASKRRLPALT